MKILRLILSFLLIFYFAYYECILENDDPAEEGGGPSEIQ